MQDSAYLHHQILTESHGEAVPPSDGAAGDLASMRSRTEAAATPRLSSTAISAIIDLTSRHRKRKNQAGQDGKGRKRLTGDPVEARQEEAHQKAKNAIDAAQEALWAHGRQSQECRDALRLAEELVNINGRMRGGPQAGGSASAMCPATGRSDSTVGCAAGSSGSTMGCEAGSSGSAEGPGLASEEAEEEFSEIEVEELE